MCLLSNASAIYTGLVELYSERSYFNSKILVQMAVQYITHIYRTSYIKFSECLATTAVQAFIFPSDICKRKC
jgi:hypothetical protein